MVDLDGRDVYWQMAMDEAMLILSAQHKAEGTLRPYNFTPSAVAIGYFQKSEKPLT